MGSESREFEETAVADTLLEYLAEHPSAGDTLDGITQWWIRRRDTRVGEEAVSRVLESLTERGELEATGSGPTRHYRVRRLRDVGYESGQLRRLATQLQDRLLGTGTLVVLTGTGREQKTLVAETLADALKLVLYRVSLSDVLSRYIGETEKNLGAVFDEAARSAVLVFFDEADALFGRRSDEGPADERDATAPLGYLLRRIDDFSGTVLLSVSDSGRAAELTGRLRRARSVVVR